MEINQLLRWVKDAIQYNDKAYGKDGMLQLEYSNIGHLFVGTDWF